MAAIKFYPHTRLIRIINQRDVLISDVRINFIKWPLGGGVISIADTLEPWNSVDWDLSREGKRIAAVSLVYTMSGKRHTTRWLRSHLNSYFHLATFGADEKLVGVGRAQGVPAPAYYPNSIEREFEIAEDETAALVETSGPAKSLTAVETEKTQFLEVLNLAETTVDLHSIDLISENRTVALSVQRSIPHGKSFDVECGTDAIAVGKCRFKYVMDGKEFTTVSDFSLGVGQTAAFGCLYFLAPDSINWAIQTAERRAGFVSDPQFQNIKPRVEIVDHPSPILNCHAPQRLKNFEKYDVHVTYRRTFTSVGPSSICSNTPQPEILERDLGPEQDVFLGCAIYSTTSMWCAEHRQWEIISAVRIPAPSY